MFPEQFAAKWIESRSKPGDVVLDPFSGRGTTPFQALLMDRQGVGADINPVAACLNLAKLAAPSKKTVLRRLDQLQKSRDEHPYSGCIEDLPEFFHIAFHRETLRDLLFLREVLSWRSRRSDSLIAALVLGALHGEVSSTRYLSNQMPRTISTKPAYSLRFWKSRGLIAPIRDVFSVLRTAVEYRYSSTVPTLQGIAHFNDMRELPRRWKTDKASLVVTSPPYGALTSYEEDQWLRLWALGGPSAPGKARVTRDDRLQRASDYWSFIGDFWRSISLVTKADATVVVRVGAVKTSPQLLAKQFAASLALSPRAGHLVSVDQSSIAGRQTRAFTPGTRGCGFEVDLEFLLR